jgi:hypothetical protein
MMAFIETYHLTGVLIGALTFLIIGAFHPLVIKGEYYFGVKCWWFFLFLGFLALVGAILIHNLILSILCGVVAFSSFWGIKEVFEQRERVKKGWFPKRTKN